MSDYSFGFIGAGNMGGTLAAAAAKTIDASRLFLADHDAKKAGDLAQKLGCRVLTNEELAARCDYIFLGVKPQFMAEMLAGIRSVLAARKNEIVLVTMAAGLSIEKILTMAGGEYPVIRIMPNTPAAVGEGMILYDANSLVSAERLSGFQTALSAAGRLDPLAERLIDAASAISGCGPAYVYLFIEALADGGVECGLPRAKALEYAAQTVLGSAKMALCSGKHPGQLKDDVCSPGGTTIAGVHALESGAFRALAMDAVKAAYDKTVGLGK